MGRCKRVFAAPGMYRSGAPRGCLLLRCFHYCLHKYAPYSAFYSFGAKYLPKYLPWVCAVIKGRLHAPDFACGSPQIGEIQRLNCRAPYRCCCLPPRREDECNEFGSPLSKASPVLSLGTTVSQAPTPQSPDTPYEVAPPTPGTDVKKDPDQPGSKTPRRTEPKTDGTPPDQEKKPGSSAEHYRWV